MSELAMFEGQYEVMIITKEEVNFEFKGDFLVRAKDVAAVLGYSQTNDFVSLIKTKYIHKIKNSDLAKSQNRKLNNAGEQFISNFGLNQGLANSTMPKAEPFQDWLYEDMLPSVQKHGAYLTADTLEKTLSDPDFIIKLATEIKSEREKRLLAERQVESLKPKIAYLDTILQSKGLVTTTQVAKDYGLTAPELNKILHDLGIQYLINKQWVLYRKHADKGYTQSYSFDFKHKDGTPDVKMNTRWTQNGRKFIHEELTKLGIKANIEKEFKKVK